MPVSLCLLLLLFFFHPREAVGGDFVNQILFDGVDVAVVDIGVEVVAFDDDVKLAFDGADVFEVRVALGFGFRAGVFDARFTDDDVIADDMPLCFIGDAVECFGGLSEREGLTGCYDF